MILRVPKLAALALAAVCALFGSGASADNYPSKPVRMIIPYPPGGTADTSARIVARRLSEELAQPVVVESRPGAGGAVAMQYVSKAEPDGYTLIQSNPGPAAIALALFKNIGYTEKDFAPVSVMITAEMFMVVPTQSPIKTAKDLAALGRSQDKARALTYGSSGIGAPSHLAGEMFNRASGTQFAHVPYKGATPLGTAILSGEVDWAFMPGPDALSQIRAAKMRPIAVAAMKRSPLLPETPTLAELGISGLDLGLWYGLLAPAKTPKLVIDLLNQKLVKILNEPETRQRLLDLATIPSPNSPEEFERLIRAEVEKYAGAVKLSGAKVE